MHRPLRNKIPPEPLHNKPLPQTLQVITKNEERRKRTLRQKITKPQDIVSVEFLKIGGKNILENSKEKESIIQRTNQFYGYLKKENVK